MTFTRIDRDTWPRHEHFDHYYGDVRCTYSLTVDIDITTLLHAAKAAGYKTYPAQIHLLAHTVNAMWEMRMAVDDQRNPGYYAISHPSYTVLNPQTKTFSSLWTPYDPDFAAFHAAVLSAIDAYGHTTRFAPQGDEPPNTFSISSVPWLPFTAFNLNVYTEGTYLAPIFTIGQHKTQHGRTWMPLAIQMHHAACDGYHIGLFIQALKARIESSAGWMT